MTVFWRIKISLNQECTVFLPSLVVGKLLKKLCDLDVSISLCGTKITKVPDPNSFSALNQLKYLSISWDNYFASHHEISAADCVYIDGKYRQMALISSGI